MPNLKLRHRIKKKKIHLFLNEFFNFDFIPNSIISSKVRYFCCAKATTIRLKLIKFKSVQIFRSLHWIILLASYEMCLKRNGTVCVA